MAGIETNESELNATAVAEPDFNHEESIRLRAYELYLERGRTDGSAEEDWLRAENEVLERPRQERDQRHPETV